MITFRNMRAAAATAAARASHANVMFWSFSGTERIRLPVAAKSVYGLDSSFLITNRGGQSMQRQAPESLGFTGRSQVLM